MKRQLTKIRNLLLADFWESHKADYKVKELGQIFGITESTASKILSDYEKTKDPLRFMKRHIKRSHRMALKEMNKKTN